MGGSTRILEKELAALEPKGHLSSVDHDPAFLKQVQDSIHGDHVAMQLAPLVVRDLGGQTMPVYSLDPKQMASTLPADLALIDGPPETLGGRSSTIYQILDYVRPGTLVLFDDAGRPDEQAIVQRWKDDFQERVEFVAPPGFPKGMVVALICQPLKVAELWAWRQKIAARELSAYLKNDTRWALVDDNQWDRAFFSDPAPASFFADPFAGPPASDDEAIARVEQLKGGGCRFLVFAAPSAWWLSHYTGLHQYLASHFKCLINNQRITVFDLQAGCNA